MYKRQGYDIITTLITDIELPKDVERSMNAINSAQRDQEAAKALAEAERTKTVVAARAQAEAMEQTLSLIHIYSDWSSGVK